MFKVSSFVPSFDTKPRIPGQLDRELTLDLRATNGPYNSQISDMSGKLASVMLNDDMDPEVISRMNAVMQALKPFAQKVQDTLNEAIRPINAIFAKLCKAVATGAMGSTEQILDQVLESSVVESIDVEEGSKALFDLLHPFISALGNSQKDAAKTFLADNGVDLGNLKRNLDQNSAKVLADIAA